MRECSEISDVTNDWRHFIVTMVATLACRADHVAHDALIHAREFADIKRALINQISQCS
jgi:hypothetical protein